MDLEKNTNPDLEVAPSIKSSKKTLISLIVVTLIISSFFGAFFGFMAGGISSKVLPEFFSKYLKLFPASNSNPAVTKENVIQEDSAVIDVVQKSSPAVVSIVISKDVSSLQDFFSSPFDFPFQPPTDQGQGGTQKQTIGGGSGFLITSDGMIVTNKHVVSDTAADYTVITNDNKEYPAKVLAKDLINDIAIIKIDGSNFPTLNFGNSDSLQIGQTVVAIGNSLGEFSNTVSRGIVSGLRRSLTASGGFGQSSERLTNIIQTDAAINPGNSGGPLLDINGNVIGINVAIAQGAQNIGFAIPANQIKKIANQVQTTGKISTPYLGVRYIPIDKTIQQSNNLPFNYGVLVLRGQSPVDLAVIPGSPADKAGVLENDIILEINGTKIDQNNDLSGLVSKYNVGDQITLKIWDKGQTKNVSVKLEERK